MPASDLAVIRLWPATSPEGPCVELRLGEENALLTPAQARQLATVANRCADEAEAAHAGAGAEGADLLNAPPQGRA